MKASYLDVVDHVHVQDGETLDLLLVDDACLLGLGEAEWSHFNCKRLNVCLAK